MPTSRPAFVGLAFLGLAASTFAMALVLPGTAQAHFVLVSPAASLEQNDLGDPQKVSPCGDNGSGVATGEVTVLQAGSTVTLTIEETVYHPGHYRVAIAQTPEELPAEPPVTPDNQSACGSVPIMSPATMPVLADGVFVHDTPFGESQTIEITLPDDFTCTNCTMQVMQWMHDHGAPCFYYHCAQVTIEGGAATGDPTTADDTAGTTDDPTDPTDATATTEGGGDDSTTGNVTGASASASATAGDESSDGTAATGTVSAGSTVGTEDDESDGGCGCTTTRTSDLGWLGLFAVGLLRRRRRA
jgi:MYXO-CTERM domain-containing protein